MRIAIVHSFYTAASPSGENEVVRAEAEALCTGGHTVEVFSRSSDDEAARPLYRVRSALRVATGHGDHPGDEVAAFGPDIVHVHNTFPNISHAWLATLRAPFVHTLHNFRPFCASSDQFRAGGVCQRCTESSAWNAVRYRCYRDSALASAPLAIRTARGPARDPLFRDAAAVIALTDQMHAQLREAGIPESRIERWPNFLPDALDPAAGPGTVPPADERTGFLAVGRFTPAKGLLDLVRSWPDGVGLTVVGSGPDQQALEAAAADRPAINLPGRLERHRVLELMRRARALVVPSRWLEGAPLIYPEALACGLPVLATDPSSVASRVEADGTGLRFGDVEALASGVAAGLPPLPDARRVREVFERHYTEQAYRRRADELYARVAATAAPS